MRRLLVICAVTVAVLVAFTVARKHVRVAHAASSNPGNLSLVNAQPPQKGCALGPAFTFCDERPGTTGPAGQGQFSILAAAAVTNVSVSLAAIPGLGSNFAAGDFTIINNTCTGNLAANATCTISLAFSPTTAGLRQAALVVTDAQGDTLAINIEGTGKNLVMAPPPVPSLPCPQGNAYTYCAQAVGSASSAEGFTLAAGAAGASGVSVSLAAIPGLGSEFAADDFRIVSDGCTGTSLAADGNCSVSVEFTPTTAGLRSAALTATDSQGDSPTIYLAGNTTSGLVLLGQQPSTQSACARVNWFGFCNEPSGGISTSNTITLTNTSGAQVTDLVITPPVPTTPPATPPPTNFTVESTTCTATLAANASCTISVAFTPLNTGLLQGEIGVTDAQGDVTGFNLAGVGDDYELQLASGQTAELTVAAGGTATFKAQVAPDNVFGMNGEQVTFVCPTNLPVNTSCTITPCPASVTAATAASFQIALVTSSASIVAPVPPVTTGCASYGLAGIFSPGVRGPEFRSPPAPAWCARAWRFPAPLFTASALMAVLTLLALALGAIRSPGTRRARRIRLIFVAAGLAIAALPGCHHKGPAVTSATPTGTTTMTVQGNALDASGNSLNASRPMPQIILDVTAN